MPHKKKTNNKKNTKFKENCKISSFFLNMKKTSPKIIILKFKGGKLLSREISKEPFSTETPTFEKGGKKHPKRKPDLLPLLHIRFLC